jgi:PRD domain protein (TIGR03582 family)
VKDKLNLSETEIENVREDLEYVEKVLEKHNINFQANFEIAFYNHIISFISRAKTGEFIAPIEDDMISEISEEAIEIASEMLKEIFLKYKRSINKSEIYLVSTHIQIAMNNK